MEINNFLIDKQIYKPRVDMSTFQPYKAKLKMQINDLLAPV